MYVGVVEIVDENSVLLPKLFLSPSFHFVSYLQL